MKKCFLSFISAVAFLAVVVGHSPAALAQAVVGTISNEAQLETIQIENGQLKKEIAALREQLQLRKEYSALREKLGTSTQPRSIAVSNASAAVSPAAAQTYAADFPAKAPVAPLVAPFRWTGFYVGANVGLAAGKSDNGWNTFASSAFITGPVAQICGINSIFATTSGALCISGNDNNTMVGAIGGLQAGYNWQVGSWLLGYETDIQFSSQKRNGAFTTYFIPPYTNLQNGPGSFSANYSEKLEWLGTTRVRAGFIAAERWVLYGTGGMAFGQVSTNGSATVTGVCGPSGICPFATWSNSDTRLGWVVGAGIEGAVNDRWTLRGEYLHVDLGTLTTNLNTLSVCPGPGCVGNVGPGSGTINSKITNEIVRVAVNYRL